MSGTVTFSGRPVPYGEVVFEPDPAKGNRGPQAHCPINNGRYATRPGFGVPEGPVVVVVSGCDRPPSFDYLESKPLFPPHTLTADIDPATPTLDIVVPIEKVTATKSR
jgi:hypothetical protein